MKTKGNGAAVPGKERRDAADKQVTDSTIRAVVRDEVRRLLGKLADDTVYSTKAGEAPAGYSRDGWRALAHAIGKKRGRYYYVTATQLEAYEAAGAEKPADITLPKSTWSPEQAARAVGLRVVGGSR